MSDNRNTRSSLKKKFDEINVVEDVDAEFFDDMLSTVKIEFDEFLNGNDMERMQIEDEYSQDIVDVDDLNISEGFLDELNNEADEFYFQKPRKTRRKIKKEETTGINYFELDKLPKRKLLCYLDQETLLSLTLCSKSLNKFIGTHMLDKLMMIVFCMPIQKGRSQYIRSKENRELIQKLNKCKRKYENIIIHNIDPTNLNRVCKIVKHFDNLKKIRFNGGDNSSREVVQLLPNLKALHCKNQMDIVNMPVMLEKFYINLKQVEDELELINFMANQQTIEEITLIVQNGFSQRVLDSVLRHKTLRSLDLRHTNDNHTISFSIMPDLLNKELKSFTLQHTGEGDVTLFLKIFPNISKLNLEVPRETINVDLIEAINGMELLEHVKIQRQISEECFKTIKCSSFLQFSLMGGEEVEEDSWEIFLKNNSHIKGLKINGCRSHITPYVIDLILEFLPNLQRLELLYMFGEHVYEDIVTEVCEMGKNLKVLTIVYCHDREFETYCNDRSQAEDFPQVEIKVIRFVPHVRRTFGKIGEEPLMFYCSSE